MPDADGTMDLTQIGPSRSAVPAPIRDEPYDPSKDRESVRGQIALNLVWTFMGIVGLIGLVALVTQVACSQAGVACPATTTNLEPMKALGELIITPLVGLVGAVSGFYFGEKSASNNR